MNPAAAERIDRLRRITAMLAPWEVLPNARGWSMGPQETVMWDWQDWYRGLTPKRREKYRQEHPLPSWMHEEFYDMIVQSLPTRHEDDVDGSAYWNELMRQYGVA